MHKRDWEICADLIKDELERRQKLSVKIQEKLSQESNKE
jgi:hypothetical protein